MLQAVLSRGLDAFYKSGAGGFGIKYPMLVDDAGNFITVVFVPLMRGIPKASVVPKTVPA